MCVCVFLQRLAFSDGLQQGMVHHSVNLVASLYAVFDRLKKMTGKENVWSDQHTALDITLKIWDIASSFSSLPGK